MNGAWTEQKRRLLDQILDQLIPANSQKSIPSAGEFGVGEFVITRAYDDEVIAKALDALLISVESMGGIVNEAMVSQLESNHAKSFSTLLTLTYMGYYSRPHIRSLVGVGSWPVHPKGYEVPIEPCDFMEKLTAPVRERGPAFRDPNDQSEVSS